MKLFAIYISGELAGTNIELHDMRFVVAPTLHDTYPELRRQWWEHPKACPSIAGPRLTISMAMTRR
jgi:hypothetical protein